MATSYPPCIDVMLRQLGGNKIFAMAFKGAVYDAKDASLTLQIANSLRRQVGATHVLIKLDPSDTYTVQVVRVRSGASIAVDVRSEESDVYAEDLRPTVERLTGLALSLGTMGQARRAS